MDLKNAETHALGAELGGPETDRAASRRDRRIRARGHIRLNGRNFDLIDWSISGFRAEGFSESLEKGARYPIELNIDIDDEAYFFECRTILVRLSKDERCIAGVFIEMNKEDRLAVLQYFEELR